MKFYVFLKKICALGEIACIIFTKKNTFFFYMIQNTMLCSTKESIFVRFFTKCSMLLSVVSKTNTFRSCKKEHVLLIMKKKNIFGILSTKLMFCQWNWYFFSSVFCNWNDEMIFFLCFYLFLYNFIILIHVTIWKNRWNVFFFFFE